MLLPDRAYDADLEGVRAAFRVSTDDASTVTLEALNFQIKIVADELVPFPAGFTAVTDQDRLPDFVG